METGGKYTLMAGDCLERLKELEPDSVDSLVTDPPAGISFMGKDWDSDKGGREAWIAWMRDVMKECARVLKPGAHGLVWALPRTSHWTATALEDAGFEIRDVVTHLFGQGFPKSLNIGLAIDKMNGLPNRGKATLSTRGNMADREDRDESHKGVAYEPSTDAAKEWSGWGTALKPASEHWILVRKPISEKTVAANVLKHGTGGINIDGSRIEGSVQLSAGSRGFGADRDDGYVEGTGRQYGSQGRFPANLVLSHSPYCTDDQCDIECAVEMLDQQSGPLKSGARKASVRKGIGFGGGGMGGNSPNAASEGYASRFFYCAKISSSERNAGLEGMPDQVLAKSGGAAAAAAAARGESYFEGSGFNKTMVVKNHHPTVKPKKLMGYLIRLITPPGGVVLDPFMGSGSTGLAALENGFRFIGIEREPEYLAISEKRIEHAEVFQ